MQGHLATFLAHWEGTDDGRSLPRHVTGELREFLTCGSDFMRIENGNAQTWPHWWACC
jgi:hypothetical protein